MAEFKGIDVSKYQGVIDWQKVKAAGIQFAFIRIGWAGYAGGIQDGFDPYFHANMAGAIAAGVPVGVYAYFYCKTPVAASKYAKAMLPYLKQYKISMPVVCDFEDAPTYKNLSRTANSDIAGAFLQEIEAAGYYAMLYSYKDFVQNYLDMTALAKYDFWLSHYTKKTNYTGPHGIWQYSSTGSVPGITGKVDMNIAYKDYPAIIATLKPPSPSWEETVPKALYDELEQKYQILQATYSKLSEECSQIKEELQRKTEALNAIAKMATDILNEAKALE